MARHRRMSAAVRAERVAHALDGARRAQTSDAALLAGETVHGLIDTLRDELVDGVRTEPELAAALAELGAALQQVHRLRLSKRHFVHVSVEEMVGVMARGDALASFEREYQGRHVRWRVKFKAKAEQNVFVVHAGTDLEVACALDPCVPDGTLESLEPWQVVTLEGRFASMEALGSPSAPRRARMVFDQCIVA